MSVYRTIGPILVFQSVITGALCSVMSRYFCLLCNVFRAIYFDHWSSFVNNRPITSKIKIPDVVVMNVDRGIKLPDLILS